MVSRYQCDRGGTSKQSHRTIIALAGERQSQRQRQRQWRMEGGMDGSEKGKRVMELRQERKIIDIDPCSRSIARLSMRSPSYHALPGWVRANIEPLLIRPCYTEVA